MENFDFKDRPDQQRIAVTVGNELDTTTAIVAEMFIDFQWTYREMQRTYDNILNDYQLSESKFILLMFLKQAPAQRLSPSQLADKLGATRATTTKLLNKMATSGWVKKEPDPHDQRSVLIQLLPAGTAILESFLPANFHSAQAFFADFTEAERLEFKRLLTKIKDNTTKLKEEMEN